jgi:type II secretory pathway pseudopilin PulG
MKTNRIVSQNHDSRGHRHAFTLLELLVVIGTLAVLAVLMVPALARTDDNDTRMVCMNNLRQMGMAENMYLGDSRDQLPYPNWDSGSGVSAPQGWLYSMKATDLPAGAPAGQIPNPCDVAFWKANPTSAWKSGAWFQYVQNTKAYLCPVDIESKSYTTPTATGGRSEKLSSYVMNGASVGFPSFPSFGTPCKITDIWSPACYLLWEPDENASNPGEYNDGANYPTSSEGIGRLHSAYSGNMLCVGGNVQFVTVQAFKNQSVVGAGPGPGGKTLAWWDTVVANGD